MELRRCTNCDNFDKDVHIICNKCIKNNNNLIIKNSGKHSHQARVPGSYWTPRLRIED